MKDADAKKNRENAIKDGRKAMKYVKNATEEHLRQYNKNKLELLMLQAERNAVMNIMASPLPSSTTSRSRSTASRSRSTASSRPRSTASSLPSSAATREERTKQRKERQMRQKARGAKAAAEAKAKKGVSCFGCSSKPRGSR